MINIVSMDGSISSRYSSISTPPILNRPGDESVDEASSVKPSTVLSARVLISKSSLTSSTIIPSSIGTLERKSLGKNASEFVGAQRSATPSDAQEDSEAVEVRSDLIWAEVLAAP